MKIYENANDQHVRKVVIYEVSAGLAFDKAGTELLTKEQIVDAFLKGCVVENEGNYKTPTGVNVTDSGAELVFGGGGSGGPEVENAIATHGMGWTESEEVEGFNITWDGDTEGLESVADQAYKVTSKVDDIASKDDLIGAKIEVVGIDAPSPYTLSADDISTEDGKVFVCSVIEGPLVFVAIEDGEAYSMQFAKGVWFFKTSSDLNDYVSRLYKEASTEEVVHQIDEKYIPQGSFVIDYSDPKSDDYEKAIEFFDANRPVYLSKDSSKIPMTGYNSTHCFFGGTVSAYLPGGYVICVYAHIGPEGTNYFWYQYNSPVEVPASAMVVNFTPTYDDDVVTLSADKTPAEVKSAMLSGPVVGTILFPFATEISPLGSATLTNDLLIGFNIYGLDAQTLTMKYMITCNESFTEWILHQG